MTNNQSSKLNNQLKKLNDKLDQFGNKSKFMIYSANPFKFAIANFIAGTFFALGRLFGNIAVFGAIIYFLSQINLTPMITKWMENTLAQINWQKIVPQPKMQLDVDLNQLKQPGI